MRPENVKAPENHLPKTFWTIPARAKTVLTTRALQETVLYHDGRITSCGKLWDIKSKRIAPGVYRVWLREFDFREAAARKERRPCG